MATDFTTVFVPLISEDRLGLYLPANFQTTARQNDPGIDIEYSPLEWDDRSVFMVAPGEVFFVAAGTTVVLANGPEITAPGDRNVVVVHVVSTYKWAPILAPTGQPVAEWWAYEGITDISFGLFLDTYDLEALADVRGFDDGGELRTAILTGAAGLNVLLTDEQPVALGTLGIGSDVSVTLGVRSWASYDTSFTELDARSALASLKHLAPSLENHPLLTQILSMISASDVTIHVRFVYWETKRDPNDNQVEVDATSETDKGRFCPVPRDSRISLQKRSPGPVYAPIVEETVVDDSGQVALLVPRGDLNAVNLVGGESLVFRVGLPANTRFETQYQHQQTPRSPAQFMIWGIDNDAWVTYDRSTTDNSISSLDFLVALESTVVGSSNQPLEYYAGIPVFLQIQYPVVYYVGDEGSADFQQEIRKAPKGLRVEILSAGIPLGEFRTDEHGQIWGHLLQANDMDTSLDVRVHYELEDESIKLPIIRGEVLENNAARYFYEGNTDHYSGEPFFGRWISNIGSPGGGTSASGLATLQIGTVAITNTVGVSNFDSVNGRDAGIIHALQHIRYMHQWFHTMTEGYLLNGFDRSWAKIIEQHNGGQGVWASNPDPAAQNYSIALPYVRVTEPLPGALEERLGEVQLYATPDGTALTWWLILYGYDSFSMNRKMAGNEVALLNKVQFWREHTIWHEFSHAILNMVYSLAFDMDAYNTVNNVKFADTSGRINEPIPDGWSTLDEAVAAIPEVILNGKFSGISAQFDPSEIASPRYLIVYDRQRNIGVRLNDGMNVPTVLDWRLGLRVPMAFTYGLWTALKQLGGFDTLHNIFGGPPTGNHLKDSVDYLNSLTAKRIFQNLVWGPLNALGSPQDFGPPQLWDDLDGTQAGFTAGDTEGKGGAGPAFGLPGSRRIRITAPSTHRFMDLLQQQFWLNFLLDERYQIKDLFGDVDDVGNQSEVSFYLWFDF